MFCAIWYHVYNFLKRKNIHGKTLLKVTLLHGCFSSMALYMTESPQHTFYTDEVSNVHVHLPSAFGSKPSFNKFLKSGIRCL